MNIGKNLKTIRESKKLSIRALAKKSGVSSSYISDLENGKNNNPSVTISIKLANALEISETDLYGTQKLGTSDTYVNDEGKVSHVFSKEVIDETMTRTKEISDINLISAYISRKAAEKNLPFIDDWKQIIADVDKIIDVNLEREKLLLGTKID